MLKTLLYTATSNLEIVIRNQVCAYTRYRSNIIKRNLKNIYFRPMLTIQSDVNRRL